MIYSGKDSLQGQVWEVEAPLDGLLVVGTSLKLRVFKPV